MITAQQEYSQPATVEDGFPSSWSKIASKKEKLRATLKLTEPIVLPSERDAGWVPDWMFRELRRKREEWVMSDSYDETLSSDLEAAMYLCCASFFSPLSEQSCRIYFHVASKLSSALKEAMTSDPDFQDHLKLQLDDKKELIRFKRWIRRTQKRGRNPQKARRLAALNDRSAYELQNADLLVAESQL